MIRAAPGPTPTAEQPVAEYLTDEINCFDLGKPQPLGGPKMGAPLICRDEALGTIHLEAKPTPSPSRPKIWAALGHRPPGRAGHRQRPRRPGAVDPAAHGGRPAPGPADPAQLPAAAGLRDPGLKFDTHYVPALKVGGDFYDLIQLDPSHVGVLVGDISGKGISAALLMAKVTTDIRLLSRMYVTPAEVMTEANKLAARSGAGRHVRHRALHGDRHRGADLHGGQRWPPATDGGQRRFEGVAELDDATAVALGVVPGMEYPQKVYRLMPEDAVLLYTDGINEAMNRQTQEYGMDRLRACVGNGPADPARLLRRVLADIRRFVGGAPQSDDQTLVVFGLT